MLFNLTTRLVCSVTAFLYPAYSSYKTLSLRPASEAELERWLMYWSVLGCVIGIEYSAEWLLSWIPFYYTTKTLFLLYLAVPQTQGASYLYTAHLRPFFYRHETQIDATLAQLKVRAYTFVQERIRALWQHVVGQQQQQPQPQLQQQEQTPSATGEALPGPVQLLSGLWRSYGPGILASGAALIGQARQGLNTTPVRGGDMTQSDRERRRRQLEAELAALEGDDDTTSPMPMPVPVPVALAVPGVTRSSGVEYSELRERMGSRSSSRFEEVEVPSDVEGYEVEGERSGGSGWWRS